MKLGAAAVPPTLSVALPTATLPGSAADPRASLLRAVGAAGLPLADARGAGAATGVGEFQRAVLDTAALAAPAAPPPAAARQTTANLPTATLVIATSASLPPLVAAPADAAPPPTDEPVSVARDDDDVLRDGAAADPSSPDYPAPDAIMPLAGADIVSTTVAWPPIAVAISPRAQDAGAFDRSEPDENPAGPAVQSIEAPVAPALAPPGDPQRMAAAAVGDDDAATGAGLRPKAVAQSSATPPAERGSERPSIKPQPPRMPASAIAAADTLALAAAPEFQPVDAPKPSIAVVPATVELPPDRHVPVKPKPPADVPQPPMAAVPSPVERSPVRHDAIQPKLPADAPQPLIAVVSVPVELPPVRYAAVQPKPPADTPQPPMSVLPVPVELPIGSQGAVIPKPPAVVAETGTIAVAMALPAPVAATGESQPIARSKPVIAAPGDSGVFAVVPTAAATIASPPPSVVPVVHITVQPQQLARDVGRAMARQLGAAGNEVHIRLDPAQLGRIDVRLSFDDLGTLRAVVGAETAQVLDLLRRDSADLGRAMADAGVRSDSQSFRFEDRGGDARQDRPQPQRPRGAKHDDRPDTPAADRFQPLRWRGQMNVIA
jgi:hypothetical protein